MKLSVLVVRLCSLHYNYGNLGAREMAHWLGALAVLPKDHRADSYHPCQVAHNCL